MSDTVGFDRAQSTYDNVEPKDPQCLYGFYEDDKVWVSKKQSSDYGFEGKVLGFDEGLIKVEVEGDTIKWVSWFVPEDLKKLN